VYEGTYRNNNIDGIIKCSYSFGLIAVGEMLKGDWTGKRTAYFEEHQIENQTFEPGCSHDSEIVTEK